MNFFYHKDLGNHLLQLCPVFPDYVSTEGTICSVHAMMLFIQTYFHDLLVHKSIPAPKDNQTIQWLPCQGEWNGLEEEILLQSWCPCLVYLTMARSRSHFSPSCSYRPAIIRHQLRMLHIAPSLTSYKCSFRFRLPDWFRTYLMVMWL